MHIELTEMLRCPEQHREEYLVLSTGEVRHRMVRSGILGCPVCRREYPILRGVVDFTGNVQRETENPMPVSRFPFPEAPALQALLELSGPGGYIVLAGSSARHAAALGTLMAGVHFVGVNAPPDLVELDVLSLLKADEKIPLRSSIARGVVVGADLATSPWLVEAHRVLLRGRRFVVETAEPDLPIGLSRLAAENGVWVGEKT
jgi:uncharacterized protein YbaR (Trm112 family)